MRKYSIIALLFVLLFLGCDQIEHEPFDHPFFFVADKNLSSSLTVNEAANLTGSYYVYLSARKQTDEITVNYEVTVGNGLKAGEDFELQTEGKALLFKTGVYDRIINIRWKSKPIDPTKDNSLKIRLVSNTKNYTLGYPGPSQSQRELVITKVK